MYFYNQKNTYHFFQETKIKYITIIKRKKYLSLERNIFTSNNKISFSSYYNKIINS